jgi:hypothetical protein
MGITYEKRDCITCNHRPKWDGPYQAVSNKFVFFASCYKRTGLSPYTNLEVPGSSTAICFIPEDRSVWEDAIGPLEDCKSWAPMEVHPINNV